MLTQGGERTALAFKILDNRSPQITALGNIQELEEGRQADLMVAHVLPFSEEEETVEQVLDPQKGTDTFIAWVFKENHATYNLYRSVCSGVAGGCCACMHQHSCSAPPLSSSSLRVVLPSLTTTS